MKIQELIDTTLSKLPKSEMPDSEFDIGYQIITSDCPTASAESYVSMCFADASKLETMHCQQILNLIELYKDMQCFVRVMPEITEADDPIKLSRKTAWYTRLQFKKVCRCPNCGYIIYKEDIWIK